MSTVSMEESALLTWSENQITVKTVPAQKDMTVNFVRFRQLSPSKENLPTSQSRLEEVRAMNFRLDSEQLCPMGSWLLVRESLSSP